MPNTRAIGIFDSGVGGLSIAKAIHAKLPNQPLHYMADLAYSPYGTKTPELIAQRSQKIVRFLIEQGCQLIVVACNTATVNTIAELREQFAIPIVGVEPGIKPAVEQTKTGVVGVLATEQTLQSQSFAKLKARFELQATIITQACPRFVELVEAGDYQSLAASAAVDEYLQPLLNQHSDQIILGCTHYSFLADLIKIKVGDGVNIIDTADAVAAQVARMANTGISPSTSKPAINLWTTKTDSTLLSRVAELWGQPINIATLA